MIPQRFSKALSMYFSVFRLSILFVLIQFLGACGGAKLVRDPEPLALIKPLSESSEQQLELVLDWVIVRAGPGTWAKNADWDEYLLRVRNLSDETVHINGFAIHDALDERMESSDNRKLLVKATRSVVKRYKGQGLKVKAGMGGAALVATGSAAYVAGASVGLAALSGSSAAASVAGAAVVGILAAPVLVIGGAVRGINNGRVAKAIVERSTSLPVNIEPSNEKDFDVFFPLAPSPKKIELMVGASGGEFSVFIDTSSTLKGLHLELVSEQSETAP